MMEPARSRAPGPIRVGPDTPARPDGYPRITPGSIEAPGPRSTSANPGSSERRLVTSSIMLNTVEHWNTAHPGTRSSHVHHLAAGAHRRLDGRQRPDHGQTELPARDGRSPGGNRVHEFLSLVLERLARFHFRADDVAVADEQLELAVRVGHRLAHRDAALEHAHALGVVQVVEDEAAPAAHGNHFADLVRVGPAHVDVAHHLVAVPERRKRDVVAFGARR